ncbi:MAG: signal peptidase II [Chloroflexi bacterium]|nr:signal peptidase II [Chloroflexota bacterium]
MQKVSHLQSNWRNAIFLLVAFLVVAADQLSKTWIRTNLAIGQSLPETGFFRLTHVSNTGAAFGLFRDQSFALTIIALIGIVVVLLYGLFTHRHFPFLNGMLVTTALGLALGGTLGNLIDRLRLGYITDFIDIGIWPAFNLADSSIVVGVGILVYCLLLSARKAGS